MSTISIPFGPFSITHSLTVTLLKTVRTFTFFRLETEKAYCDIRVSQKGNIKVLGSVCKKAATKCSIDAKTNKCIAP